MEFNYSHSSLEFFSHKSLDVYKEWLDTSLKLNKMSSILTFLHLSNFIKLFQSKLGYQKYIYLEKLFYLCVELKLEALAKNIIIRFVREFGRDEPKIYRMEAQLSEINTEQMEVAAKIYKKLISYNQEDRTSIKKYLAFIKPFFTAENMKRYVDLWNDYLKVYMDDVEVWYELSDVYLQTANFNKAIYCLEEVLLHLPNNYEIYTRIGDILSTMNNTESCQAALKYYSQSILVKPSPRAFWGMVFAINVIHKANKSIDDKTKSLLKIAKVSLQNFYSQSPFKITVEQFFSV